MSELYTGISQFEKPPKFAIVSAISNWLDGRVDRFLRESKYPENRRYLRHWLTEWSIEDFKIQKIAEIIERLPDRDYIVIFDNSNASIGLATRLAKEFPGKIKTVYLRRVVEKATPKNAVSFFSAFDIAMHEFAEGRLGREEVEKVADAILREADVAMIFPRYAVCPRDYNPCDRAEGALAQKCAMVRAHAQELCKRRD